MREMKAVWVIIGLIVLPSLVMAGLVPLGGEFQINTTTEGIQSGFSVGTDDAGNFVAVWTSPVSEICDTLDFFIQLFDSNGNKISGEITGPEVYDEQQYNPNVAMDADGDFVVVWYEGSVIGFPPCFATNPDGDSGASFAQMYFSNGTPNGAPLQVNTTWQSDQLDPVVAMNGPGDFVVVWRDNINDGDGDGVYAQLFDSSGNKVGSEQLVNQSTDGDQWDFDVSINDSREWIVVWRGPDGDGDGVFARRYDSSGNPIEGEWLIHLSTIGNQRRPHCEIFNDGSFILVWTDSANSGDIYYQLYDNTGSSITNASLAHYVSSNLEYYPNLGVNRTTRMFFITWAFLDSDGYGSKGRVFKNNGEASTSVFQINTIETGNQIVASIAFSSSDKITMCWNGTDSDGGGGIGKRYQITAGPLVPMVSSSMLVLTGIILMMILIWAVRKRKIVLN